MSLKTMSTSNWKIPSVPKLIQLITQVQSLQNNTTNASTKAKNQTIEDKRVLVPAYGLGIGKSGNRAYVTTMKSGTKEASKNGMKNDTDTSNFKFVPLFENCNQRKSGYILDKDFYYEWLEEDECSKGSKGYEAGNNNNSTSTETEEGKEDMITESGTANSNSTSTNSGKNTTNSTSDYPIKSEEGIVESPPLPSNYKLVWNDEFDGNKLDLNKWEFEVNCLGGGNDEEQCYVAHDDVLKVQDGNLIMTAIRAPEGYALMPYDKCNADPDSIARGACTNRKAVRSARIHTRADQGGKWKYGRFEMKAKIPIGNFLWPAFWMLPSNYKYGTWAASGEFDIMESRGQKPNEIGHAIHYGGQWPNNVYSNLQYVQEGLANEFNIYGLDWNENSIKFYVNNRFTYQLETNRNWTSPLLHNNTPYTKLGQPWDQDFIMLLNLAVGGTFFSGAKYNPNEDYKTWKQSYIIDYIRVYQKTSKY
ncbi:concanavalin A-like lectin/glucanase [Neoconidiobolus thromboides FSU 785]|nr:concanavalin A-like lectin/glucanase [Neoconidiobolus thromboides FSU 785]